jgi:hypothetical protein
MSVDSAERDGGDDATIADIGSRLEDMVADELDVDRRDIRVRVEHQPLAAASDDDYLTRLEAHWTGDGPEEVRER